MACVTGRTGPAGAGAGQVWRMALAPPGGTAQRGPAGCGRPDVRGGPAGHRHGARPAEVLGRPPWAGPGVVIERARHRIRAGMRRALDGHRYAPVLIALAIGDQAGSHARIGGCSTAAASRIWCPSAACTSPRSPAWRACWPRSCGGACVGAASDWPSARRRASWAAWRPPGSRCCIACSRAGAPARRTFFMLATVLAAVMSRLP